MSRMSENSAGNLDKGVQPKWDFQVEPWTDFQHKVEIWAASQDIAHLLERDPYPSEQRKHDTAMCTVLLNLPSHDRAYVRDHSMLHKVWSMLNSKYMLSVAAEATKLWIQFEGLRQRGRPMQEHSNECMTVRKKRLAIREPVPDRQFTHKLLNVDKELYHVRAKRSRHRRHSKRTDGRLRIHAHERPTTEPAPARSRRPRPFSAPVSSRIRCTPGCRSCSCGCSKRPGGRTSVLQFQ